MRRHRVDGFIVIAFEHENSRRPDGRDGIGTRREYGLGHSGAERYIALNFLWCECRSGHQQQAQHADESKSLLFHSSSFCDDGRSPSRTDLLQHLTFCVCVLPSPHPVSVLITECTWNKQASCQPWAVIVS